MGQWKNRRCWIWIGVGFASITLGLLLNPPKLLAQRPRVRMEYTHREVDSNNIDETLTKLDGDGWEIVQIAPVVDAPHSANVHQPFWIAVARRAAK